MIILPFFRSHPKQISSPIDLNSGEFYFIQAIMKAGASSYDHLGVGVRQPDGKKSRPILDSDLYYEIPGERMMLLTYSARLLRGDRVDASSIL